MQDHRYFTPQVAIGEQEPRLRLGFRPNTSETFYYTDVALWLSISGLRLSIAAILCLALAGCDRGSKPAMIGSSAPDFTVQDSDRTVSLHDFRGKVVVLNFWATWCPPCIEEMPSLVAMQRQLGDRVTVLAVSTDVNADDYQRFVQSRKLQLLTVRDGAQKSNALYGTFGFPETYVIDGRGIVRRKFIGPVEWTKPEIVNYLLRLKDRQ
jgi:cytochrome c biogenesis protein CcmG/thiol:disulfide interchange protein DsbE